MDNYSHNIDKFNGTTRYLKLAERLRMVLLAPAVLISIAVIGFISVSVMNLNARLFGTEKSVKHTADNYLFCTLGLFVLLGSKLEGATISNKEYEI